MALTRRAVRIAPPRERISPAYPSATRRKSMTPVVGAQRARIPAACGSISRIRSGPISSIPSTPLASARSRISIKRGSSDASSATTSLPHRL